MAMPHRRFYRWVGKRHHIILTGLLFLSVGLAIIAGDGYVKARDAQQRLTAIEFERAQEAIGKRVADVATCFNRARSRPQLTRVLRGIGGLLPDTDSRQAAQAIVEIYERDTPGRADCIALAKKLEVDPAPYLEEPEPNGVGSIQPP